MSNAGNPAANKPKNDKVPLVQTLGWASRAVSMSVNVVLIMQLTYFCTNVLGMSAALTGGILFATKIFDGFTDLGAGALINRVRTRFGQVRHYEFCVIPMWLCTFLLFSVPATFSTTAKSVWIFVFYALVNAIFSTLLNSSDAIYLGRSFPNPVKQAKVLSANGIIVMIFAAVVSIVLPGLMDGVGKTDGGWTKIALLIGVPAMIIGIGRFIFVKEADVADAETAKPVYLKEGLKALIGNKYIFIVAGASMLCQVVSTMYGTAGTYYFKYIVGDLGMLGVMGFLGIIAPVFLLFFPALLKKFGPINITRYGLAVGIVGYLMKIFAGASVPLLLVTNLIGSVAILPISMMINPILPAN